MKKETAFETELAIACNTLGWTYIKIPDTKMINKQNRHLNREQKRPFDAIISTEAGLVAIECKIDYNKLKEHQFLYGQTIHEHSGMFYVLRKVERAGYMAYIIEDYAGKKLYESEQGVQDLLYKLRQFI